MLAKYKFSLIYLILGLFSGGLYIQSSRSGFSHFLSGGGRWLAFLLGGLIYATAILIAVKIHKIHLPILSIMFWLFGITTLFIFVVLGYVMIANNTRELLLLTIFTAAMSAFFIGVIYHLLIYRIGFRGMVLLALIGAIAGGLPHENLSWVIYWQALTAFMLGILTSQPSNE